MQQTTREQALDLIDEAKYLAKLHPEWMWAVIMLKQAEMIEKLVSQLDETTLQ